MNAKVQDERPTLDFNKAIDIYKYFGNKQRREAAESQTSVPDEVMP